MNAGSIIATLKLRVEEFSRGIQDAKGKVNDFSRDIKKTANDFKKVGGVMTAAGTGLSIGIGKAVRTAADFESAMSRVGALSGATEKEMKLLTKEARRLGATTVFSATEAAEAMQYLAMAGFDTKQIIAAMPGVLNMAAAGGVALGDAANIATNIMSGFNLEASEAGRVADVLTKAFTNSNTTLYGLGETMKYAAPAAAAIGWSLEEVTAAAAKLGDVGIDASMAGTALRSAMVRLSNPTKKARDLLEKYNIQVTDADGKVRPLHDILAQMKDRFANLSEAERAAAVQTIFGTEAMSAMLALMEDPEGLRVFTEELENAGGTAEKIADQQMDNLSGSVEELKSAFEEVQIGIGTALIPILRSLADGLTNLLNKFNSLPEGVKNAIAIFLALSAVLLVVGGGLLLFIGFIPNIIAGFQALMSVGAVLKAGIGAIGKAFMWLVTNPIGWVILGIAALIAAIVLIWQNWDTVKEKTIEIWETIKGYLSEAWDWLKEKFQAFLDTVKEVWSTVWGTIKEVGSTIWNAIKETFITVWNIMWEVVSTILAVIYAIIATVWEGIKALAEWIWGYIGDYVIAVWEGLKNAATTVWNAIKNFFTTVLNGIKTVFTTVWNAIKSVVTTIWNGIKSVATTVWNGIKSFFTTVLNAIKNIFTTVWNAIKSFLLPIWNSIKSIATSVFNSIRNTISSIMNRIKSVITSVWNNVKSVLTSIWNSISSVASSVWNRISSIISNVTNTIRSKVSNAANFMRNTFTSAINKVKRVFSGLWGSIKRSLDKVVDGIKEKVGKAKEFLSDLNPFKRRSPSLVDNVIAGVKVIKDTYQSIGDIRITPPQIGHLSAGRIDVAAAFSDNVGGGGTTYNAPLVNVENMHVRDESDVRNISRELFNLQRHHDRARGGR